MLKLVFARATVAPESGPPRRPFLTLPAMYPSSAAARAGNTRKARSATETSVPGAILVTVPDVPIPPKNLKGIIGLAILILSGKSGRMPGVEAGSGGLLCI